MFNIGQFFTKIKGKQGKEILIRQSIVDAIKKHTGIDIPLSSVEFRASIPTIKGLSSAQKSAIFIKKTAIIADVNNQQSFRRIDDIR